MRRLQEQGVSCQQRTLTPNSGADRVLFFSTLLSLCLPQPPTTYFSLLFISLQLVPWHCSHLSRGLGGGGGRITDESPGVLDSAVLVRAQHILARPSRCHTLSGCRVGGAGFPSYFHHHIPFICPSIHTFSQKLTRTHNQTNTLTFHLMSMLRTNEERGKKIEERVGMEKKIRGKKCKCYLRKVIVISPCPWSHSASLPITALIKTDKVSLNEERAVGGLKR